ncbi:MAG: hypothetical protein A2654_01275 [Candidatus Nealsonbacteria bacterium RIFCSPHIGHO2_01_FULL_43_31]|uniref:Type 4 fimbrial biogenesis protein PilX N-terminal domain-containing protein n=2 Tax=Candidatus Nealsoniibacteriota TaxID=1817911 RepID=A0A1G2E6Y5_9BACT|nr:MAG: hypothetical protein UV98_C0006G0016 [Parcubacteria group bacterium GW2011_GWB1_43_6]OGZ20727.1 MAG: hypothetical protein A2654_01275 [Candidatus Nealsonbacteria bacterium RIFCSPHIGHO2_01_FULL_43_31]OGZ21100.1 MAG: hypothetical protein A3D46_01870 [Candidatus Nealsonbacteria bacterium RIFCSPHIGHO2_02_FULL_43_13]OGZ25619.1 MAG: hypothetical protein A2922_01125 [Candidatus Nealsonbacteria bacterium RIFCSPLOWO2_01_FULL_43_36]
MKYPALNIKHQRGVALYFALVIITMMLSMALGLSAIFIGQIKTIKQLGNSVLALAAADTGIEVILLNRNNPANIPETALSNGATYQVVVSRGGSSDCPAGSNYCIKSVGSYLGTKRAVEIIY